MQFQGHFHQEDFVNGKKIMRLAISILQIILEKI
jgi:hypothetical protein